MSLYLNIETCSAEEVGKGLAFLDPAATVEQDIQPDDIVEISTAFGKSVLARVAPSLPGDKGQGMVRIDRYLCRALKAEIGDRVEMEKVSLEPLVKAVLAPLVDVTFVTELDVYLRRLFSSLILPANKRSILYAKLPGATAGGEFKVVEVWPAKGGVFTKDTTIEIRHLFPTWPGAEAEVTFEDVGGLRKEIQLLRELVELPLTHPEAFRRLGINPPRGVVLYGPPGVGKTQMTRAIANELDAEFHYIRGPEIIGTHYGETESNLRKVFEDASHHLPSIILVDELDVVVPKRGVSGTLTDTRMSTQFLELLDGMKRVEGVMVVGTTNRIDAVDAAVRRPGRFDREIFIGPPNTEGRLDILHIHTRGMPLSPDASRYLPRIAKDTYGFVGADLMELCREAGLNALRRRIGQQWASLRRMDVAFDDLVVDKEDFQQALTKIRPSALREATASVPDVRWEDIGGLQEVKERLRELVEMPLQHPEVFASLGVRPPTGLLLYGPPGTGKTLLAKAIANECNANFIAIKGSEIYSKWVGESEQAVRHVFQVARQAAPTIIFFDQLEAIAPRRVASDVGVRAEERVVSQLLSELDGIESLSGIIVIGATNRLDLVDTAILRPGRLGVHLYIPLPDEATRREIFQINLQNLSMDGSLTQEKAVKELAALTESFSGAEIEVMCQEAKLLSLKLGNFQSGLPLKREHLLQALEKVRTSRGVYSEKAATA